jgi:hypothetical protein
MSEEFIQFNFPCAECLVRAACQDKPKKMIEVFDKQNPRLLAMPDMKNIDDYLKVFLECWANIGFDALDKIRNAKSMNGIPETYANFLIETISMLQWIVNSASWDRGEIHDFDIYEVRHKLRVMKRWMK